MNIDLLKRLCETPGVPGHEHRVRALIEREIEGLFDEVRTDPMGSLLCRRAPRRGNAPAGDTPQKVMLLCHMDEIGFLVSHITDKGFIYVQPVGGFDPRRQVHQGKQGQSMPLQNMHRFVTRRETPSEFYGSHPGYLDRPPLTTASICY